MRSRLLSIDRYYKKIIMATLDIFVVLVSLYLSFVLRLGSPWPSNYIEPSWWLFLLVPSIIIFIFFKLRIYNSSLQSLGKKIIYDIFKVTTISCLVVGFFMMFFREQIIPRSVIPIFWFISNMILIISRFFLNGFFYSWEGFVNERKETIIYGAGSAGLQLLKSLRRSKKYNPIAFIDDDIEKQGNFLSSLEIFSFMDINNLINRKKAKVILYAIPSANNKKRKIILKKLSRYPIEVKVLPSIDSITDGKVSIENIKHVGVGDILGRTAVSPKENLLKKNITGKNILITGAGGSIGAELSRQIKKLGPNKIILYDNSEFNLYSIHHELILGNGVKVIPVLATVTNYKQLNNIIKEHKIHTIYHAAAYKHVPMVEMNMIEGVYNNVIGTYYLAKAAEKNSVDNMVLVSTDKAVRPTNVMGASKRFSELILQALADDSKTCFSMVRFGNVLDSAGSVVPLFRKQIKEGGPVTVTHRNISRYFMSIPEAVQLVLQAGAMAKGGDVFVLDMGEPIKILDLAYKMIHLSGLKPIDNSNPDGDILIEFTGLRPGEKLYEELLIGNNVVQSEHPSIMQARENKLSFSTIENCIDIIIQARIEQSEDLIKTILLKYVDGYSLELVNKR